MAFYAKKKTPNGVGTSGGGSSPAMQNDELERRDHSLFDLEFRGLMSFPKGEKQSERIGISVAEATKPEKRRSK